MMAATMTEIRVLFEDMPQVVAVLAEAEAKLESAARLRAAVAALMAANGPERPWWYDSGWYCFLCGGEGASNWRRVKHTPDCPAMAVEAAMKEGDDGR